MSEPTSASLYYADPRINGFVVECGEEPFLMMAGEVTTPWKDVPTAVKYGWRIVGGTCNGMIVMRRSGFN